tara:strand:- start:204 stop:614 length:411 start_codon:yes stop_codon:yes gene_type:complete
MLKNQREKRESNANETKSQKRESDSLPNSQKREKEKLDMKDTRIPVTIEQKVKMLDNGMNESQFNEMFRIKGEKGGLLAEFMELNPSHALSEFVRENASAFVWERKDGSHAVIRVNGAKHEPKENERVITPERRDF